MFQTDDASVRASVAATGGARRNAFVGAGIALLLLTLLAATGLVGARRDAVARARVEHSLVVLRQALELEAAAERMEGGQRGYLVNGDPGALAAREAAQQRAAVLLRELRSGTADNPYQQRRLQRIATLLDQRYVRMRRNQELAADDGLAAAQAQFRTSGPASIDPVRSELLGVRAHESALLAQRSIDAARERRTLDAVLVLGIAAAFAVLAAAGWALLRLLARTAAIGEQLRRYSHDLDNLFRLSRDLICVLDGEGRFLRLNPAWERTLGHPAAAMAGQSFLDFVHPEEAEATRGEIACLRAGHETVSFENRVRDAHGRWRWMIWNAAVDPATGLAYATARDITERKHAEQRIDALNAGLRERTQAAEAANRELEAFSYSVSHDLRAPLRHIDGFARMLVEDAGERLLPEDRRKLDTITDAVRRMGALIDDLLALSRYGRKPLEPQPVDMAALARDALRELPAPLPDVRIGELPRVEGDPALLRQVWANLLSNAVKYSAPRGPGACVQVDGERLDDRVRYRVRDNGVGFDMRHAGKLFGVFQRLHGEDRFEGTGVGLAIVQRVVHRHGGEVRAEAAPDAGATFTFDLPAPRRAA